MKNRTSFVIAIFVSLFSFAALSQADTPPIPGKGYNKVFFNSSGQIITADSIPESDPIYWASDNRNVNNDDFNKWTDVWQAWHNNGSYLFNGEWTYINNRPTFATVATSGVYSDLTGKPTIPTNTNQLTNGSGFLTSEVDGSVTNEIELASQAGNANKYLITNGTTTVWATAVFNASPGRVLSTSGSNNTFTISTTKNARVNYTINFSYALTLTTSNGLVSLDYSTDSGSTWTTISSVSSAFTLAVTLTGNTDNNLSGEIPANALVRLYRSANSNVTVTASTTKQQEVTY